MSSRLAFYKGLVLGEGLNYPEKVSVPLQGVETIPGLSSNVTTIRSRGGASELRIKFESRIWQGGAESRRDFQIRRIALMKSLRRISGYAAGSYTLYGTLLFIEETTTDLFAATAPIAAGSGADVTLPGEHPFLINDWAVVYDPVTEVHDVAVVTLVTGPVIKLGQVDHSYSAGVAVARVLWGVRNALPVSLPEVQGDEPGHIVASPNLPFEFISVEDPFGRGIS